MFVWGEGWRGEVLLKQMHLAILAMTHLQLTLVRWGIGVVCGAESGEWLGIGGDVLYVWCEGRGVR